MISMSAETSRLEQSILLLRSMAIPVLSCSRIICAQTCSLVFTRVAVCLRFFLLLLNSIFNYPS